MSERRRKVFSLRESVIGAPMTLRESARAIDALDSTGALVAQARWVPGHGWGIVQRLPYVKVIGYMENRDKAERMLRLIVGGLV